jgi:hypothetical protein
VSIFCFISIVTTLHYVMRAMLRRASADMCMRYSLHVRINVPAMRRMLKHHTLFSEEADTDVEGNNMYKVAWEEPGDKYGGSPLKIEISVDQGHARLCTLNLKYNRRDGKLSVPEVQHRFLTGLVEAGVIADVAELGDLIRPPEMAAPDRQAEADMHQRKKDKIKKMRSAATTRNNVKMTERVIRKSESMQNSCNK